MVFGRGAAGNPIEYKTLPAGRGFLHRALKNFGILGYLNSFAINSDGKQDILRQHHAKSHFRRLTSINLDFFVEQSQVDGILRRVPG